MKAAEDLLSDPDALLLPSTRAPVRVLAERVRRLRNVLVRVLVVRTLPNLRAVVQGYSLDPIRMLENHVRHFGLSN